MLYVRRPGSPPGTRPRWCSVSPFRKKSIPSVVMNDGTRRYVGDQRRSRARRREPRARRRSRRARSAGRAGRSAKEYRSHGASANTLPTERSISPQISSITSPAAMSAIGAIDSAMFLMLSLVEERAGRRTRSTARQPEQRRARMLASRRRSERAGDAPAEAGALRRFRRPWLLSRPRSRTTRPGYFCALRAAFVAGLGRQVRLDVLLGDEQQAGVRLGRGHEPAGELVEEQLEHRQKPCRYGCWSMVKSRKPAVDQVERSGSRSKPPPFDLPLQAVLLDDLADALGVSRRRPRTSRPASCGRGSTRRSSTAPCEVGVGRDAFALIGLPDCLIAAMRAVDARLDVERARAWR